MGNNQKCPLLIVQFQRAVKKLKSLLHYWRVRSGVSRISRARWCSRVLKNHQMVFQSFLEDEDEQVNINNNRDRMVQYRRTVSYGSEDDIDERAEIFIANFRRQLSLERRVYYLEPQYCIRDSFEGD